MNVLQQFWNERSHSARIALVIGTGAIVFSSAALGWWAYRTDYQVLFSDLAATDAAAMAAELDKSKVPYQLADDGNTILVPKDMVYKTRLKVMGKEVPLHGAVGFEVFNNADFGMTEFVQKVNYQRAVQGELTRTIMAIDDVQAVRVHLAIPDQGLFKKASTKSKASVTITMKSGHALQPIQVQGIQRLVSAAVPEMTATDVTVVDQHGLALTKPMSGESVLESGSGQLDAKRSAEEHILRKVSAVLEQTYGVGQAIASVDLVLNLDQSRVTTEEVLPARATAKEGSPTGVVVRERSTQNEGAASTKEGAPDVSTTESDYQVGRRVEQLVSTPGATRRMTIAVVVRKNLDDVQSENLRQVVALAAGFDAERGDAVVVYSMDRIGPGAAITPITEGSVGSSLNSSTTADAKNLVSQAKTRTPAPQAVPAVLSAILVLVLGVASGLWIRRKRRALPAPLSDEQRAAMLVKVQQWMADSVSSGHAKEGV